MKVFVLVYFGALISLATALGLIPAFARLSLKVGSSWTPTVGDSFTLICSNIDGVNLKYLKNGTVLTAIANKITIAADLTEITISSATKSDSGKYQCSKVYGSGTNVISPEVDIEVKAPTTPSPSPTSAGAGVTPGAGLPLAVIITHAFILSVLMRE